MIVSTLNPLCVLACIGYVGATPSPEMYRPPAPQDGLSHWAAIRTDEAAWQAACGHEKRVGAVCLDAKFGQRNFFLVEKSGQQNAVFSQGGHYFHAYCPNLDKGEHPYTIQYIGKYQLQYLRILGRTSSQRCCPTMYIDDIHQEGVHQCVEPAAISAATFPPNDQFDHN